jgi:hypothetical protein
VNRLTWEAVWYPNVKCSFKVVERNVSATTTSLSLPRQLNELMEFWFDAIGMEVKCGTLTDALELMRNEVGLDPKNNVSEGADSHAEAVSLLRRLYPSYPSRLVEQMVNNPMSGDENEPLISVPLTPEKLKIRLLGAIFATKTTITDHLQFSFSRARAPTKKTLQVARDYLAGIKPDAEDAEETQKSVESSWSLWTAIPLPLLDVLKSVLPELDKTIQFERNTAEAQVKASHTKLTPESRRANDRKRTMMKHLRVLPMDLNYQCRDVRLPDDFWKEDFFVRMQRFWALNRSFHINFPNFHTMKFTQEVATEIPLPPHTDAAFLDKTF